MVVDRQMVLPRQLPVTIKDWAHSDAVYRPVCVSQAAAYAQPVGQAHVWGRDSSFLHTWGVHALEGGCSVQWLFVYMQIFVIKTIS